MTNSLNFLLKNSKKMKLDGNSIFCLIALILTFSGGSFRAKAAPVLNSSTFAPVTSLETAGYTALSLNGTDVSVAVTTDSTTLTIDSTTPTIDSTNKTIHSTTLTADSCSTLAVDPVPRSCGRRVFEEKRISRIVGGRGADEKEFPWQVFLSAMYCGGALISATHALTAAHCLDSVSIGEISASVGHLNRESRTEEDCGRQTRSIKSAIVHPNYISTTLDYDIAILEMNEPFRLNDFVQPVCLPGVDELFQDDRPVWVSGFGRLSDGGPTSTTLQAVQVFVVTRSRCEQMLSDTLGESFICAGVVAGGKDACAGDSGGPLVSFDAASGHATLVGLVSWGYGCAQAGSPGVYTDARKLRSWVVEHVGELEVGGATSGTTEEESSTSLEKTESFTTIEKSTLNFLNVTDTDTDKTMTKEPSTLTTLLLLTVTQSDFMSSTHSKTSIKLLTETLTQTTTLSLPQAELPTSTQQTTETLQPMTETLTLPMTEASSQFMTETSPQPMTLTSSQPMTETSQPTTGTSTKPMTATTLQPMTETSPQPMTRASPQPMTETSSQPMTETSQQTTGTSTQPMTETTLEPMTKTSPHPTTETSLQTMTKSSSHPTIETSPQPMTETSPQSTTETSPHPTIETSPHPTTSSKPTTPSSLLHPRVKAVIGVSVGLIILFIFILTRFH